MNSSQKYRIFNRGDLSAFFALMPDNMATLAVMVAIMSGFGIPLEISLGLMVPGTAFGVLVGDLIYTWLAVRLAKRERKSDVTAIPLGLDTPSCIGIVICVIGPVFLQHKNEGLSAHEAGISAWHIGIATMLLIGIFKVIMSFFGGWIQKKVPQAALLGSLGGVGIALLGFLQLDTVFTVPIAGLLSLSVLFFALIARMRLPGNIPGVLTAVLLGTIVYHLMGSAGLSPGTYTPPPTKFYFHLPTPTLSGLFALKDAMRYITVSLPFAILTVVGGINVGSNINFVSLKKQV